jgi:ABC-2 type transport system ATP-binding protein
LGLESVEKKRCEELSKGMQQQLGFAAAVLHGPELLVLDEPFSGLDPVSSRLVRELLLELHRDGTTVLFSTHVMAQAEELCERVVMIHDGVKVLDAPVAEIRGGYDPRSILFEPLDPGADPERLRAIRGIASLTRNGAGFRITLTPDADPAAVLGEIVSALPPARVELERKTLDDVFVEIVSGTRHRGDA